MKYFGIRELIPCVGGHCTCDAKLSRKNRQIIIQVPSEVVENAIALVENVLDPLRMAYGKPIRVNSGYRCPMKNRAVNGVDQSQHLKGEAVDIAPAALKSQDSWTSQAAEPSADFKAALEHLAEVLVEQGRFDQLIVYPTFLHVSYKRNGRNRGQILRRVNGGYRQLTADELKGLRVSTAENSKPISSKPSDKEVLSQLIVKSGK